MRDQSLKGLIPILAKSVGKTPAALYERQRALARAGMMQAQGGRGPGSGVRATPDSVALLLISILATDNLSETERSTRLFANLRAELGACPITSKKTFAGSLRDLLASKSMSDAVHRITVHRTEERARIDYLTKDGGVSSSFEKRKQINPRGPLIVSAQLVAFPLVKIAKALHSERDAKQR